MTPHFDHSRYTEIGVGNKIRSNHYVIGELGYPVPVPNEYIGTLVLDSTPETFLELIQDSPATVRIGDGPNTEVDAASLPPGFPVDALERKNLPIVTGVLDYFPLALLAVAECSKVGNDQHNPGQPLHWSRGKSSDHVDALGRHLLERGRRDKDNVRHSAKVAWRALAILQLEIEAEGNQ